LCFQREARFSAVPGVDTSTIDASSSAKYDFCYDPNDFVAASDVGSCSPSGGDTVCTVGEGPCSDNYDCFPGLRCMQRSDGDIVPYVHTLGHVGPDVNLCYQGTVIGAVAQAPGDGSDACLKNQGRVCGRGQADCDSDEDCEGSLRCFQREKAEQVPGVKTGPTTGIQDNWDVCYDMQDVVYGYSPDNNAGTGCTASKKCAIGGGDCDSDADCYSGQACFQREQGEQVPGVASWGANIPKNHDVCIASGNTA